MKNNITLRSLNLSENKIGDSGATAIGNALKTNAGLQKLDLAENPIGDAGAKAIATGLKTNKTIKKIFLSGYKLTMKVKQELKLIAKRHGTMNDFGYGIMNS